MKIETKYSPKESVWVMFDNAPKEVVIKSVSVLVNSDKTLIGYIVDVREISYHFNESDAFKTKAKLVASLLKK